MKNTTLMGFTDAPRSCAPNPSEGACYCTILQKRKLSPTGGHQVEAAFAPGIVALESFLPTAFFCNFLPKDAWKPRGPVQREGAIAPAPGQGRAQGTAESDPAVVPEPPARPVGQTERPRHCTPRLARPPTGRPVTWVSSGRCSSRLSAGTQSAWGREMRSALQHGSVGVGCLELETGPNLLQRAGRGSFYREQGREEDPLEQWLGAASQRDRGPPSGP